MALWILKHSIIALFTNPTKMQRGGISSLGRDEDLMGKITTTQSIFSSSQEENDIPILLVDGNADYDGNSSYQSEMAKVKLEIEEETVEISTIEFFDPDTLEPNQPVLFLETFDTNGAQEADSDDGVLANGNFELIQDAASPKEIFSSSKNGKSWTYKLKWKGSDGPNFDAATQTIYDLRIRYRDSNMNEGDEKKLRFEISITPVNEPPEFVGDPSQNYQFEEDDGFRHTINLQAFDQEGDKFRWMLKTVPADVAPLLSIRYTKKDGTESVLTPHLGSAGATGGVFTEYIDSNESVSFHLDNDIENSFGTVSYLFIPFDDNGSKEGNPFVANISIENDFADPISLRSFRSPEEYEVEAHGSIPEAYRTSWHENRTGSVIDFLTRDPDSDRNQTLQIDNNTSGNAKGAQIFYSLEGPDAQFFSIDENGSIFFRSPPNYEKKLDATDESGERDNVYVVDVFARDAANGPTSEESFSWTQDKVTFFIEVLPLDEKPYLRYPKVSAYQDSRNITLDEDQIWLWDRNAFPRPANADFSLKTLEEEGQSITWRVAESDQNGTEIIPRGIVTILPADGIVLTEADGYNPGPLSISYNPFGTTVRDFFRLEFFDGNSFGWVDFNITLRDKPNPPILTEIEFADGQGPADSQTYIPSATQLIYAIEADENYPPVLTLKFADESDGHEINSTQIYSNYLINGRELFSGRYPSNDPSVFELSMNFSDPQDFDYENPPEEGNYSVVLRVLDEAGQKQDYEFQFVIINRDEAPVITVDSSFDGTIKENTANVAVFNALDPDVPQNSPNNINWEVVSPLNIFELNASFGQSVQLRFKENVLPDYENPAEREWNVTIRSWETEKKQDASRLFTLPFFVTGVNDPPRYNPFLGQSNNPVIYLSENNFTNQSMDLRRHFEDDENDSLSFEIVPSEGDTSNRFLLNGSILEYDYQTYGMPDYENADFNRLSVTVRAKDALDFYSEPTLLVIQIVSYEEAPLVFDEDGVLESFFDEFGVFNQRSKPIPCDEDPGAPIIISNLTFEDPEGTAITISKDLSQSDINGSLLIIPPSNLKPNYEFTYMPPVNQSGEFELKLNVLDAENTLTKLTLVFNVIAKPDPPLISWMAPVHVQSTESNGILNLSIEEGDPFVLQIEADDSMDGILEEKSYFEWVIFDFNDPRFLVSEVFELVPGLSGPDLLSEKRLFFKETPDFGSPPPSGKGNTPYTFKIGVTDVSGAIYSDNPELFRVLDVRISLLDVANEPPVYLDLLGNNFVVPYTEETNQSIITLQAIDPDLEELAEGEAPRRIFYTLDGNSYGKNLNPDDFFLITNYDFNGDPVSATMYFKNSLPDFENPTERAFSVEVRATEFDSLGFAREYTDQVVSIKVVNVNEPPYFEKVENGDSDANFSLLEESEGLFEIRANTEDAVDKLNGLLLELSGEGADDSLFSIVSSSLSEKSLNLAFLEPPNYEKPLDHNFDNDYQIEVVIKTAEGVELLSDQFIIRVTDSQEKPSFTHPYLSNLSVDENEKLAIRLEVEDTESEEQFIDLLYTTEFGVSFVSNSWIEDPPYQHLFSKESVRSVSNDFGFESPHFVFSEDMNNDGAQDVIVLTSGNGIWYFQNSGFGKFDQSAVKLSGVNALPKHAIAEDFDFDGDVDLLVAIPAENEILLYNNQLKERSDGLVSFNLTSIKSGDGHLDYPIHLASADFDNDYDLDFAVVCRGSNSISWFSNDGEGQFSYIAVIDEDLSEPRSLEVLDLTEANLLEDRKFGCMDLAVGMKGGVRLYKNDGTGSFHKEQDVLIDGGSSVLIVNSVKALALDSDVYTDLVFTTSSGTVPFYSLKDIQGKKFKEARSFGGEFLVRPSQISIYEPNAHARPVVIVAESSSPALHLFSNPVRNEQSQVDFSHASISLPDDGYGGLVSIDMVELDQNSKFVEYSITGGNDRGYFDAKKLSSSGMLFFSTPPDYESRLDVDYENSYSVFVTATYNNDPDLSKGTLVKMFVQDIPEAPTITSFDGNQSISFQHPENVPHVASVLAVNDEDQTLSETMIYSLRGNHAHLFDSSAIKGGDLVFNLPPDYEDPFFLGRENEQIYHVTVRVTDSGFPPLYDEQNFSIQIVDGNELPSVTPIISLDQEIDEEEPLDISLNQFKALDHPSNSPRGIASAQIIKNGIGGVASVSYEDTDLPGEFFTGGLFTYMPNKNFFGPDEVELEFLNKSGLSISLLISIHVNNLNDRPVIQMPGFINLPENQKLVTTLIANDPDGDVLDWSTSHSDFEITGNNLNFRIPPDFENHKVKEEGFTVDLLVSDGEYEESHSLFVNVENIPDTLPDSILSPGHNLIEVLEGELFVADLNLSDPDLLDIPTVEIVGGADRGIFTISNELLLVNLTEGLDFENPLDQDGNSRYELEILVRDHNDSELYTVTVWVRDRDETPPYFTNWPDLIENQTPVQTVLENQPFVMQLNGVDENDSKVKSPPGLSYSLNGGTDVSLFQVHPTTGDLTFIQSPNYEIPSDVNLDGDYDLIVGLSDGTFDEIQKLTVRVLDANDLPYISMITFDCSEDGEISETLSIMDEDSDDNGSSANNLSLVLMNSTFWGELDVKQTTFNYAPNPDFNGTDQFSVPA